VKDADEILVFDSGDIVERGSFMELVQLDGRFAELVKTQLATNLTAPAPATVKAAE
jgi:ATP-binding cassette subfamily B protein